MTHPAPTMTFPAAPRPAPGVLPGLALTLAVALAATGLQRATGLAALSPLAVALMIGMALRPLLAAPARFQPGVALAVRPMLRGAIVLLGFQITLSEVAGLGGRALLAILLTLVASFLATRALGRWLGVEARLAELIAAGTAICGASAILACNAVTRGSDADVARAMACVTLFGTLSMLVFPLLPLGLSPEAFGLWAGASIHEVAQVLGAAIPLGADATQSATLAKLTRVLLLAPMVLALGWQARRLGGAADPGAPAVVPWFVLGFIATMALNSLLPLPDPLHRMLGGVTAFLLTAALAGLGLGTDLGRLRHNGLRALALGAAGWLFISVFGLMAVWLVAD